MTKNVLKNIQSILAIKNIVFILVNKIFINYIIKIILKSEFKAKIVFILNDNIFSFIYNMKTIILS